jgi:hypothetical protein
MAINLEAAATAGGAAERLNRQGARARQERWLAQLQDALFMAGDEPAANQRLHARRQEEAAADAARQHDPAADERPQQEAAGKAQHAAAAAPAVYVSAAGLLAPAAAGSAALAGAPAVAGVAAVAAASRAGVAAQTLPVVADQALAAPGALAAALPGLKPGMGAARDKPGAKAQAEQGQPGEEAGGASAAGEPPAYAARLLRLTPDGQGLHAWLRDASLQPAQVAAVAAALAGELAAAGQPLAGLSINGKPLPADALRAATDQARRSAFHAYTAGAQLAPVQPGKA